MCELDMERVTELFSLFSDLEGAQLSAWRGFCESAAGGIARRLRDDVDPATCMEALCAAAAGLAYSDYLAVQQAKGGQELRVGDIAVKPSRGDPDQAEELRAHFLGGVAHLLQPPCPALFAAGDPA